MSNTDETKTAAIGQSPETGPWDPALAQLRAWNPDWADSCFKMTTNPWNSGVLPRKFIELVGIGLNAACTNLNPDGTRRHIRAALEAGASREEFCSFSRPLPLWPSIPAASARPFSSRKQRRQV
jgi:alkylhydroperoxidase/carboxymuconolactone decarboxylase family protein YurZ